MMDKWMDQQNDDFLNIDFTIPPKRSPGNHDALLDQLASGKRLHKRRKDPPFLIGKSTINGPFSMSQTVSLPEANFQYASLKFAPRDMSYFFVSGRQFLWMKAYLKRFEHFSHGSPIDHFTRSIESTTIPPCDPWHHNCFPMRCRKKQRKVSPQTILGSLKSSDHDTHTHHLAI